jgi:hypothetical protein
MSMKKESFKSFDARLLYFPQTTGSHWIKTSRGKELRIHRDTWVNSIQRATTTPIASQRRHTSPGTAKPNYRGYIPSKGHIAAMI